MHQSGPTPTDLAAHLARVVERLTLFMRELNRSSGLSATAGSALNHLDRFGATRLSELAAAVGITQPAATQLVARLEHDDLVSREHAEGDRRVVLVSVTARGHHLLEARRAARVAALDGMLAGLPEADRGAIAAALPAIERLVHTPTQGDPS
ncbi:MAG: MarR family transcriptional regulator [Promicromonosporaceae bacterium]|nr:MarR family transcriptional regulator [Promicromonosporaceae bacterium]